MAGQVGLEPTTNRLTVYCANQLRHVPVFSNKSYIAKKSPCLENLIKIVSKILKLCPKA